MAKQVTFDTIKGYATRQNAIKAFEKKFGDCDVRYIISINEAGRFIPVALGEKASQLGVHFHFPVTN